MGGPSGNLGPPSPVGRAIVPAGCAGAPFLAASTLIKGSVGRRTRSPVGGRVPALAPAVAMEAVLRLESAGTGGVTGKGRTNSKNPSFQPMTSGSRSGASLPPTVVPTNSPRR